MTMLAEKLRFLPCLLLMAPLAALVGCGPTKADFRLNLVYAKVSSDKQGEITPEHLQEVANILGALFGTPDEPYVLEDSELGLAELLDVNRLKMAAGPVGRNERGSIQGLYREHCVHCHGISGDGHGPTAPFLDPYPRDYRKGTFKFTSTPRGVPPTHEDLHRILINGIPGTAMPSFRLLASDELEALVQYVEYLAIRGETERNLIDLAALGELDSSRDVVVEELGRVVEKWQDAAEKVTPVPPRPDWDAAETKVSVAKGREIFYGTVANCVKCHGPTQLGDGQTTDFDDWTKEMHANPQELIERDATALAEFLSLGAVTPRNILPRNLRTGVYRGGRRPVDLYWRIYNGIDGTPMPAAPKESPGSPNSPYLSNDDIWHLIDYVQQLPYEALSTGGTHEVENMRERN